MQYIEFDLSKNEAEIKSVDGEVAKGNLGSVELQIINAPSGWTDSGKVWATFTKNGKEHSKLTTYVDGKFVTMIPNAIFVDDRSFGIFVYYVGGQNYVETRRVIDMPIADTGTVSIEVVDEEEQKEVMQMLADMTTLYNTVNGAENDRYQMYYKAEGVKKSELESNEFKSRNELYEAAEIKRDDMFADNEEIRATVFDTNEAIRQSNESVRQDGEANRNSAYYEAEENRNKNYTNAEEQRDSAYNEAEIIRMNSFNKAEGRRNTEFKKNEANRESVVDSLAKVAKTGNYEDLFGTPDIKHNYDGENDSPISGIGVRKALETIATIEPRFFSIDELSNVADGIYISRFGDVTVSDITYIVSSYETWSSYNSVGCRDKFVTIVTIDISGIKIQKRLYRFKFDDNRTPFWEELGTGRLDGNTATKQYVDSAIGDIETSLENIIAKYGLGGDSV